MKYYKGQITEVMTVAQREAIMDLDFRYRTGILTQSEKSAPYINTARSEASRDLTNDKILVSSDFIKTYKIPEEATTILCENKYAVDLESCMRIMDISAERLLFHFKLGRSIKYGSGKLYYRPDPSKYGYQLTKFEKEIEKILLLDEGTRDFYEMLISGVDTMIRLVELYISLDQTLGYPSDKDSWYNAEYLLRSIRRLDIKPSNTEVYIKTAKEVGEFIIEHINHKTLKKISSSLIDKISY